MDNGLGAFKDSHFGDEIVRPNWGMKRSTEAKFREFVARKYGFMQKGPMTYEHNQAIEEYIRRHSRRQVGNEVSLSHPKVEQVSELQMAVQLRDAIVKYFTGTGKYESPPEKVTLHMLKWAICAVTRVSDERAIKRRLLLLQSAGLIKQVDWVSKEYAIIYGQYSDSSSTTTTKEDLR